MESVAWGMFILVFFVFAPSGALMYGVFRYLGWGRQAEPFRVQVRTQLRTLPPYIRRVK